MAATIDNRVAELERANAELRRQLDACSAELKEARAQQTATADVLGVINSSPGDLASVFDAMLEKATRLCEAAFGVLWTYDGECFHAAALRNVPAAYAEFLTRGPYQPEPEGAHGRIVNGESLIHIGDVADTELYRSGGPLRRALVDLGGARSGIAVALRKDDTLLGFFVIYRQEVRPFSDKQIALLENFAAQAVIAMENARLLTETREALEQQTATAEVLQVINASSGDLAPVFDAMLDKAIYLCDAAFGTFWIREGESFRAVALHRVPAAFADLLAKAPYRPEPGSHHERLMQGEPFSQTVDIAAETRIGPVRQALVEQGGARSVIAVPLRKDGVVLGVISAYRQEVRPFTDKQIALLQNFAAQAVIAMENARLITETREALKQQTATAEVLQVINSSPGDLAPVFDAMLQKAVGLCEAARGQLATFDGKFFRFVAVHGDAGFVEGQQALGLLEPSYGVTWPRIVAGEHCVHIPDVRDTELFRAGHESARRFADVGRGRSLLTVALRKDQTLLGTLTVYRQEVRPFSEKEIALVENFAAQAVIAMENARLLTETREALDQQTATAEVLQVINSSPGDLAPVFDVMLEKAIRLCDAAHGNLWTYDGQYFHPVATQGNPRFSEWIRQRGPVAPASGTILPRIVRGEDFIHIPDAASEDAYHTTAHSREVIEISGARTTLVVSLRKDNALLGVIFAYRQEVRPFSDKHIALFKNFAAQAVIAMENARLLTETREALEQQTATAEVLQVINSSPGDLAPVFDAMLEKALRLCEASFGVLCTYDETAFRAAALRGVPAAYAEFLAVGPLRPGPGNGLTRVAAGEKVVHVVDLAADDVYRSGEALRRALVDLGGARSALTVALLKDELLLGAFIIYRREVRAFTDKQIALLQNFAAQAVIAMENARLITETREALEQQTATAEVLQVINSSPGDLAPVFDAMIRKAVRLCGAVQGSLRTFDGEALHLAAWHGDPSFAERARELGPIVLRPGHPMEPLLRGQRIVHLTDAREATANSEDSAVRERVAAGNIRSWLAVALRTDGGLLGSIAVSRQEVRPFTDKQVALLQNFAAQAVIAMENARLLTETREALDQQTATAEVLGVINSSPGDLAPVFDAMLERAMRLCDAAFGALMSYDGEKVRAVSTRGFPPELVDLYADPIAPRRDGDSPYARFLRGEALLHIPDMAAEEVHASLASRPRALVEIGGARTGLELPLRRDDALLGSMWFYRQEVRPFSDKQIALLQSFAAQAVIAMENARLLTETREALEQQTATAEVLQVINSSPGDLAPVFDTMLDKAMRLCGVDHAALELYDGERMHAVAVQGASDKFAETLRQGYPATESPASRTLLEGGSFVEIADAGQIDQAAFRTAAAVDGIRTVLFVPLRRDDVFLGMIASARREVRPFSEKEIALLQNFAAQAVIAMENARLLGETREALEQQTATAEVLQVINSSPGDLAPVFDAMLERATRLCGAAYGHLWTYDGEFLHPFVSRGQRDVAAWFHRAGPRRPSPDEPLGRVLAGEHFVQITDALIEEGYKVVPEIYEQLRLNNIRTILLIPLRKEDVALGVFVVYRQEVRSFTGKQIALLQNFAAQAVIAMENARLLTETREALEQQTATAEVLQVINSSPGDLAPVFNAVLDKATRFCDAAFGTLWTYDGERFNAVALQQVPEAYAGFLSQAPLRPVPFSGLGRVAAGESVAHFVDVAANEAYGGGDPALRALLELGKARSTVAVPLRKDNTVLGAITAYRQEVRPFSDKQIALLQNFAAQAVIAMENARLITETREALEQQTATAEVLQVINSSPGDLAPVFDAMLQKALTLCGAAFGTLWTYDGNRFRSVAQRGVPGPYADYLAHNTPPASAGTGRARVLRGEPFAHIADLKDEEPYRAGDSHRRAMVDLGGARTGLTVPLRKDDAVIGVVMIYRQQVRPFSHKQIALLQNFAAQAVIAMENARLLNELRQRTRDLQESLEYQTATSDVLKVISQSGSEIEPVLETLLETAARICDADKGVITRLQNGLYRASSSFGFPAEYEDLMARSPIAPGRGSCVGRTALERRVVHIEDAATDPEFTWTESQQLGQLRTMLGVPLFREDALIGVISLARSRVEPFTEKQIALVRTFADQAVIAIENARLIDELRERTAELGRSVEELKMLGEVGRAVSSTLDLRAVLSTILTASLGMTWATAGAIFRYIRAERAFRLVEAVGWDEALLGSVGDLSIAETETAMSEAASRRTPIQLTDLAELPSTPLRDASLAAGLRSVLIVPLVGPERIFGALVLQRREAGEFPAETVRLMQTLASQSVLAIQNARLFREIADKSEQLALASEHKSQFLANMSHELRTPLNAILGYAELLVDGIYGVLPEKAQGVLERVQNNGKHLLALINDVLDLAKIEAGQLALTLEDYALAEVVRSVVTATEPLAAAKGLKFTAIIQDGMPMAHGDARRVSQVLLNLAGNAIKFTDAGEVEINASAANGQFVLTVRDTGPGIADADQERIFGEFQQIENTDTRKKGGTGLGLAISKRMVEMQGGLISVDSVLGAGSTFRVVLPIHVEPAMEEAA